MNLNIYMIADYLSIAPLKVITHLPLSEAQIQRIRFFEESAVRDDTSIIITPAHQLEQALNLGGIFICPVDFDIVAETDIPDDTSLLLVSAELSIVDIYNALDKVFHRFGKLEEKLNRLLIDHAELCDFGEPVLEFLENPVAMYSASYQLLFFCESNSKSSKRSSLKIENEGQFVLDEELQEMKLSSEFARTMTTTEVSIFPADLWGYRQMYYNLRMDNLYIARPLIFEVERPFKNSDWGIMKFWGNVLKQRLKTRDIFYSLTHPKDFDQMLQSLLNRETLLPEYISAIIAHYNWSLQDCYTCLCIHSNKMDNEIQSITAICSNLELLLPGSAAISVQGYILLLINSADKPSHIKHTNANLRVFLRDNLFHAGISQDFHNLMHLADYYEQACAALRQGSVENPYRWVHSYDDYRVRDWLETIRGKHHLLSLCSEKLRSLISYDIDNQRQFAYTLKIFLKNNCSYTDTVHELFIQRTALVYRLKRIEEISHLDWKDEQTRLELNITFSLLDSCGVNLFKPDRSLL